MNIKAQNSTASSECLTRLRPWGADQWPWAEVDDSEWTVGFWNSTIHLIRTGAAIHVRLQTKGKHKATALLGTDEAADILSLGRAYFAERNRDKSESPKDEPKPLSQRIKLLRGRMKVNRHQIAYAEFEELIAEAERLESSLQSRIGPEKALEPSSSTREPFGKFESILGASQGEIERALVLVRELAFEQTAEPVGLTEVAEVLEGVLDAIKGAVR